MKIKSFADLKINRCLLYIYVEKWQNMVTALKVNNKNRRFYLCERRGKKIRRKPAFFADFRPKAIDITAILG
ncbi:MAG: hypothetical protein CVT49_15050 [candidate division Zixibacteria bacterium HGW-Zixibacteria-1]|nr:MAG: hypothetical protein CVT49_15050 [candidate division Zixibacteria bacterium HGW-Zixibacteria-1]